MRWVLASILTIIILSTFLLIVPVSAQIQPTIEQLEIALWPEFDRSAVLVIYRITLAEDTPLPTLVSLPIPAEAGEPHAVAWQDTEGKLYDTSYERQVSGNWATITLELESRFGWLEFYQGLDFDGARREFSFTWPGGYSANNLYYEVQEPFDASDLNVDPPAALASPGADGLNYLRADLGPLSPTSEFSIEIAYTKTTNTLSENVITPPSPIPANPSFTPTGGTPDPAEILPWIFGGAGGLLILVAAFLFIRYRSDKERVKQSRKPQKRRPEPAKKEPAEMEASPVFCHNCGSKASASDFYCRRCGTQLRR